MTDSEITRREFEADAYKQGSDLFELSCVDFAWSKAQWAARRCVERLKAKVDDLRASRNIESYPWDETVETLLAEARAIKKEWGLE